MSPGVGLQVVGPRKLALTSFTLEWFHTCVSPLVSFELVRARKPSLTILEVTLVWFLTSVLPAVHL